jgi:hypothetical protein
MKVTALMLIVIYFIGSAMQLHAQTYSVKRVHKAISVNGKGDAAAWHKANTLTAFTSPWDSSAVPATTFSALWNDDWLYCLFRVRDDSICTPSTGKGRMDVGKADRVEIFLKSDDSMTPYYCLELDADARMLDYAANYYRKMNYTWQWPKDQLVVKSSRAADGYIVEFAISIQSLQSLGLLKDNRLQAGLFRGEYDGSTTNGQSQVQWITWIDPHTPKPDFHTPAAFGVLELE